MTKLLPYPQRIIVDGISIFIKPLTILFNSIYTSSEIPEQWRTAKIVPVYKKGDSKDISNYRPVASLCAGSKIFERLILQRIKNLEKENEVDITNKGQHGFKTGKSTNSAGLLIQSLISRALDDDNYALLTSIDLSSAFDVVNVKLLITIIR